MVLLNVLAVLFKKNNKIIKSRDKNVSFDTVKFVSSR